MKEEYPLFILNSNVPKDVKKNLEKLGKVILFETENIVYPEVSGHPDLFFCIKNMNIIAAPNTPLKYINLLKEKGIKIIFGENNVGKKYPQSAFYNVVVTDNLLIHNLNTTDSVILKTFSKYHKIHISQGYTRCSLLPVKNEKFITSDEGIYKILLKEGKEVLFVTPQGIILPGFKNGFIGGSAGVLSNKVLFTGSLKYHKDGQKIKEFIVNADMEIVELYDGPLFDAGSILVIQRTT